ncbi:12463_t:CDS:2 [Entrophospora sp. SA101]|nr:12463_t:CDS:2 [Entrophospora sp. SA101]
MHAMTLDFVDSWDRNADTKRPGRSRSAEQYYIRKLVAYILDKYRGFAHINLSVKPSPLNNQISGNCFVVDFYGYTFSSRAEYPAANDTLGANTAEELE